MIRRALRRAARVDRRRLAYVLVVLVAAGGLWRVETTARRAEKAANQASATAEALEAEIDERRVASCEAGDEVRNILRGMGYDVGVTSGVTGGEALIAVAQQQADGADAEAIEQYRQALTQLLDPALTDIVNRLPARRWDPDRGECVDVPLEEP